MKKTYTQNREISWMRFNERVLDEAKDNCVMPLEKLKFISIFVSNLTEFFMVRIGSLTDLSVLKKDFRENKTEMTAQEQIDAVLKMLPPLYKKKDELYKKVTDELKENGVIQKIFSELSDEEKKSVDEYFHNDLMPLLSPQIISSSHPFPFLENDTLYIFLTLSDKKKTTFALVPVRNDFPKFFQLQRAKNFSYILTSDVLLNYVHKLFSGYKQEHVSLINVTRNFDFTETGEIRDEFENYKDYMKAVIKRRTRQQAVRLETSSPLTSEAEKFLLSQLKLNKANLFTTDAPLKMSYVFELEKYIPSAIKETVCNKPFTSYLPEPNAKSKIALIKKKDIMLSYPFDDIKFFLDLIKEAANDPRVFSIKITIYRLAKNSKLVQYLANASENGKDVTVVMELKARFDEENNINYSDILYNAGCNILFGFEQYKIHSKICLISYRDKNKIKYITQVGTGNYNESTSKQYCDFSLITAHKGIGLDANDFFKNIAIGKLDGAYAHLLQAPFTIKSTILSLMEREKEKGKNGRIFFKLNSLTDKDVIDKIVECSNAGVKITMIIRGICCILPSIKNATENVEIRSIVGRFLEHARIYVFGEGTDAKYFIASSDLMTRNMERRIEVAAPIYDSNIKLCIAEYIETQMQDSIKGRIMKSDGVMKKISSDKKLSSQDVYMEKAEAKISNSKTKNLKSILSKIFKK
ncbi:MAG: polyphosphate kinase 1 [Treponemataceae bacterium]